MLHKIKNRSLIITVIIIVSMLPEIKISFAADSVETKAKALVDGLADNLTESPLQVTIGKLTIENSNFSSEFADNFLKLVEFNLNNHKSDFKKVKRVRNTRGGLIRTDKKKPEKVKEVTLEGSYRINEKTGIVYVTARLVDHRGIKVSSYDIDINSSAIQWKINPPNLKKIKKTEKEILSVPSANEDFKVDLWIDKGNGGVYKEGENISVMVRVGEDCYIKVLYIDASGNRILMYPTERDPGTKLRKGEIYNLDEKNLYTVTPPFGSEVIIAFASTTQFDNIGEKDLGGGYRGFDSDKKTSGIIKALRSLNVSGKDRNKALRAEAKIFLTTVKR